MSRRPENYDTARWNRLRARVLKRDGYECRESRRYGKHVPAVVVHHVYPVEHFPQFQWCAWNLISLSREAHNAMHDRESHELTEKGMEWQRRVKIPPSENTQKSPGS